MLDFNPTHLDLTGKVILDQVYNKEDPVLFYQAIGQLDYVIPQLAKPVFADVINLLQTVTEQSNATNNSPRLKLVDLGCSYGVNGMLLKWDLNLDEVYGHYQATSEKTNIASELIQFDQKWFAPKIANNIDIVGVDISQNALDYAYKAGIVDEAVVGNFEEHDLSTEQALSLHGVDLIISTGCIGYVTHKTVAALLDAVAPKQPWMAHFVLRTFSFEDVQAMASARGYTTIKSTVSFRQRKFASSIEQEKTLERLASMSIDSKNHEEDGWYYADLYLSRPSTELAIGLPPKLRALFDEA